MVLINEFVHESDINMASRMMRLHSTMAISILEGSLLNHGLQYTGLKLNILYANF